MAIQIALEKIGYDVWKIDWLFGDNTKTQVEEFQEKYNEEHKDQPITKDGFPWSETIRAILEKLSSTDQSQALIPAHQWESEQQVTEFEDQQAADKKRENPLKRFDINLLGSFEGKDFIFKEGIVKEDPDEKRYIEIKWKRYYEDSHWGAYFSVWRFRDDVGFIEIGGENWKGIVVQSNKVKRVGEVFNNNGDYSVYDVSTKTSRGGFFEDSELLFWWDWNEEDKSELRGKVSLNETNNGKKIVESRGNKIEFTEVAEKWYVFCTKSGKELVLPLSLNRKWALNAANLINAAVSAVKKSAYTLEKFEADSGILQADYEKYVWDTDIIYNVQEKFWVSAEILADWMNEYRKEVEI